MKNGSGVVINDQARSENGEPKSIVSEVVINDLRNDEIEIPGLAESGLSSEINSLSITISEIVKENEHLHAICNIPDKSVNQSSKNKKEKHKVDEIKGAKPRRSSVQNSNPNGETDRSICSSPNLKSSFERKIKEMLKEQTDMISMLHKDKKRISL